MKSPTEDAQKTPDQGMRCNLRRAASPGKGTPGSMSCYSTRASGLIGVENSPSTAGKRGKKKRKRGKTKQSEQKKNASSKSLVKNEEGKIRRKRNQVWGLLKVHRRGGAQLEAGAGGQEQKGRNLTATVGCMKGSCFCEGKIGYDYERY